MNILIIGSGGREHAFAWKIKQSKDIIFTRYNQRPQVYPYSDYDSNVFDQFIQQLTNVKNHKKSDLLLKVYIVSLFIPDIPHPILALHGEKGAAKTTIMRYIKMLVDPSKPELLTINKNQPEFVQQLNHYYVAYYDNIKTIPFWLSDEACKAVTGVGNTKRKLYSDDDIVYEYKRCLGFNGINIALTEPDALDRTILIEVERIRKEYRQLESVIDAKFEDIRPKLLGYIFDTLVKTLRIKDSIKLNDLPRMADFALWGEAISRAMGYQPLEFINAYYENIGRQNLEAVESNPLGQAVVKLVEESGPEVAGSEYYSSTSECLVKLTEIASMNGININSKSFPKSPNSLTRNINKIRSNLLEGLDIEVIVGHVTTRTDKYPPNTSTIKIRKIPYTSYTSSTLQNSCSNLDKNVEDTKGVEDTISYTPKIPYTLNEENRAQITSDIANVEDVEDVEDTFRNIKEKQEDGLDLEKINFVPISSLFKEEKDKDRNPLLDMEKPAGPTYKCPNCNQEQYTTVGNSTKKVAPIIKRHFCDFLIY